MGCKSKMTLCDHVLFLLSIAMNVFTYVCNILRYFARALHALANSVRFSPVLSRAMQRDIAGTFG
jgi:hypothetical protein